jgi:hypothetical protein
MVTITVICWSPILDLDSPQKHTRSFRAIKIGESINLRKASVLLWIEQLLMVKLSFEHIPYQIKKKRKLLKMGG